VENILNITSIEDIPCLQWGSGTVSSQSLSAIYPHRFDSIPEFFFFAQIYQQSNPGFLTIAQCKDLTEGPNNITWPQQFADFIEDLVIAAANDNFSLPQRLW